MADDDNWYIVKNIVTDNKTVTMYFSSRFNQWLTDNTYIAGMTKDRAIQQLEKLGSLNTKLVKM